MVPSDDPIEELTHDHRQLTELLFVLREQLPHSDPGSSAWSALAATIDRLQDELLTHAAREEEGLFPFVTANAPELEPRARALQHGHDAICGTMSRLAHAVARATGSSNEQLYACRELFARFEALYAGHASEEAALLEELGRTLSESQRRELRAALSGL
jgi:iron-sulfur cluster repair protein YtfE (RIC family)